MLQIIVSARAGFVELREAAKTFLSLCKCIIGSSLLLLVGLGFGFRIRVRFLGVPVPALAFRQEFRILDADDTRGWRVGRKAYAKGLVPS